jgi:hypothetical protein
VAESCHIGTERRPSALSAAHTEFHRAIGLTEYFSLGLMMMSVATMNSTVCLLTEMPESLHGALKTYLDRHPEWDQDRAIAAALSLFLMQNNNDGSAARVYLNTLFTEAA